MTKDAGNTAKRRVHYSPAMLDQIKNNLRKYAAVNHIHDENYHVEIKCKLGISPDDKRLHSSDPRHWLKSKGRHKPNDNKLDLYVRFIKKVYPEFEFSDNRVNDYIAIGLTLARFSKTDNGLGEVELKKRSKVLDRKFFWNGTYKDKSLPDGFLSYDLMSFRWLTTTPFLLAYRFNVTIPPTARTIELSEKHLGIADTALVPWKSIEEAARSSDFPVNVETGVLSPLSDGSGYHGIFQTHHSAPSHARLIAWGSSGLDKGFDYKSVSDKERDALGVGFSPFAASPSLFEKAIDDIGEPAI